MEPLIIFLIIGGLSMSAALSAGEINKLPTEEKPEFINTRVGMLGVLIGGNIAVLMLAVTIYYGIQYLKWWLVTLCVLITFPAFYKLIICNLLKPVVALLLTTILTLALIPVLYYFW